ncbi:hypothetical protein LTR37_005887 [Vermiconidia calcicola]|uniref:Uncharacterized protein n=1 Tax=Vermiconidia calcicola TaxID=1690605 RepID=A0ACC3NHN3_9PEZI|nr:hypothetical protein LTR37_005887 [Vermiconidia calcicola]
MSGAPKEKGKEKGTGDKPSGFGGQGPGPPRRLMRKLIECDIPGCDRQGFNGFDSEEALREHLNAAHPPRRGEAQPVPELIRSPKRKRGKQPDPDADTEYHKCEWPGCGKKYKRLGDLTTHVKTHEGEGISVCPHRGCNAVIDKSNIGQHIREVHNADPEQFLSPNTVPAKVYSRIPCPKCERPITASNLRRHIRDTHGLDPEQFEDTMSRINEGMISRISCPKCEKEITASNLRRHIRDTHRLDSEQVEDTMSRMNEGTSESRRAPTDSRRAPEDGSKRHYQYADFDAASDPEHRFKSPSPEDGWQRDTSRFEEDYSEDPTTVYPEVGYPEAPEPPPQPYVNPAQLMLDEDLYGVTPPRDLEEQRPGSREGGSGGAGRGAGARGGGDQQPREGRPQLRKDSSNKAKSATDARSRSNSNQSMTAAKPIRARDVSSGFNGSQDSNRQHRPSKPERSSGPPPTKPRERDWALRSANGSKANAPRSKGTQGSSSGADGSLAELKKKASKMNISDGRK